MANILIVNSSYRKQSNSSELASHVSAGAQKAGHAVTTIDIGRKTIAPCRGCNACLQPNAKGCVTKDDMQEYYPLVAKADVIIFTSPIYWFTMGGQLKQFIDRCYAVAVNPDPNGKSLFAAKKLGAVFVYGGEDVFESGCVNAIRTLQDTCRYTESEWAGAVYGEAYEAGAIKENTKLLEAAHAFGASL